MLIKLHLTCCARCGPQMITFFSLQYNHTAEYYVENASEVDLSKCTFIPEAPRTNAKQDGGHSEAVNDSVAKEKPNKLVGSPKKSPTKKAKTAKSKKKAPAGAANAIKNEKSLYNMNPKSITSEQIAKFIKSGNVEQLETAVLMGKGKQIAGKTSWNEGARNYIRSIPTVMEKIDQLFKAASSGDHETFTRLNKDNKKFVFARDAQGRTPMHVAAQNGYSEIVKAVISENAEYTQISDSVSSIL